MAKIIELTPKWSAIEIGPKHLKWLQRRLSYVHPAARNPEMLKTRKDGYSWDGTAKLLYVRKSICKLPSFPTGLIPKVIDLLKQKGIDPEVVYARPDLTIPDEPFVQGAFEFQTEAARTWARTGGRGGIKVPMGSGKSSYIAPEIISIMRESKEGRIVFLCQNKEILFQARGTLQDALGYKVGIWGGGKKEKADVMVATIQTLLAGANPGWLDDVIGVIVDEYHHTQSNSYHKWWGKLRNAWWAAFLSGTPVSNTGLDLLIESIAGPVVVDIPYKTMMEHDPPLLAQPLFLFCHLYQKHYGENPVPLPGETFAQRYAAHYDAHIVNNELRNGIVAHFCRTRAKMGESTGVLVDRIEHGDALKELMPEALWISGSDTNSARDEALSAIKEKRKLILISTLIREAVDIPSLNNMVFACAGKSQVKFPQSWRCMRSDGGRKEVCRILTFYDHKRFFSKHAEAQLKMCRFSGSRVQHVNGGRYGDVSGESSSTDSE